MLQNDVKPAEGKLSPTKRAKSLRKTCRRKGLIYNIKKSYGRDSYGHISSRYKSAGHKSLYREISFKRKILDVYAEVINVERDPNRTCLIALLQYSDGKMEYILAPNTLSVGDSVIASAGQLGEFKPGYAMPLRFIPKGMLVYNIETKPGAGGKFVRSAGTFATVVDRNDKLATIQLPSGEVRQVPVDCFATIGAASNAMHSNRVIGKAGRNRWLGRRPHVRGVAKNPVDHPHGGGEGKTSSGRHPTTPWGKKTKGLKTRKSKSSDSLILRKRKKR